MNRRLPSTRQDDVKTISAPAKETTRAPRAELSRPERARYCRRFSTVPTLVRMTFRGPTYDRLMTTGPYTRALSLSPSRARDFMQCPLLYRFRTIDELP